MMIDNRYTSGVVRFTTLSFHLPDHTNPGGAAMALTTIAIN
jgi:hypothetical protein